MTHSTRSRGGARRPLIAAVIALAVLLLVPAAAPPAVGQTTEASALLVAAGRHDSQAARDDRVARRARRLSRIAARKAKHATRATTRRRLRRSSRRHARRAKAYRKRAKRHRKQAARLRRRAAAMTAPVQVAAAPAPRRPAIPLGTALDWGEVQSDPKLRDIFLRNFNQMTPENEMKLDALQPLPGEYRFDRADEMVDWAVAHGKRVRAHVFVHHSQIPAWIQFGGYTRDELLAVLHDHIKTVMEHFRGRIAEWDVVNEAVNGNGWVPSLWYQKIGPDYVEKAFRYAHEADPQARLFYNDNGIDLPDHPHTVAVRKLLGDLRGRGVRVDGVGMQNHMSNRYKADGNQVAETMRRFVAMGLDVAVTEMDVRMDTGGTRANELAAQFHTFAGAAWACRMQPRCTSFSTWGVGDRYSWIDNPALDPLMFDDSLNPKPAFYGVQDWIRRP